MPEKDLLKTLYILWVGGLIDRKDWNPAFSDFKIGQIKSANLVLKTHAAATKTVQPKPISVPAAEPPPPEKIPEIEISLEDYLARIESAASLYDVLGLQPDAPLPAIRKAYFALAKMFHPDRFHRGDADVLRRVETAFTKLAQAHETLRNLETRRAYDTKLRREKAEDQMRQSSSAAGQPATKNINADRADQEFEHGRKLLMEDDYESALPFLARAVHFGPLVARYHAFYGKALSQEDTHRHKAENAMQQAIRLEPDNASFRMMLAEFFVKVKLVKRAEGELTRLLTMAPDHREARTLLDSLRQK
jgi:tetratricopeptide (TPR) repeat protein